MSELNIKVLGDRVLVKKYKEEGVTKGGIVLVNPESNKTTQEGEIVAVGTGRIDSNGLLIPINDVRSGNKILYTNYSGTNVKIDGVEYSILDHRDILAIVE